MFILFELCHKVDCDLDDNAVESKICHPVDSVADAPRKRENQPDDKSEYDAKQIGYCRRHVFEFNLRHSSPPLLFVLTSTP